ncbi:CAP domain-containing protein [Flavobacteriaceae bacterium F08102]|nr:CAP domain-containing protein [Flavobacteriaceae bacterium F08102]
MKKLTYLFLLPLFFTISCSEDHTNLDEQLFHTESSTITNDILKLINKHREINGLHTLKRNATADKLAENHNKYMIANDVVNHDHFNERASALRKDEQAKGVGENVAWGYKDAQQVVNAWLDSPGHKANIEGDFTNSGLSAMKDDNGTYYFTHLFYKN